MLKPLFFKNKIQIVAKTQKVKIAYFYKIDI